MQEFGPNVDAEILQNKKRMDQCDVVCLVYDSADVNSFAYVASLVVLTCSFVGKIHVCTADSIYCNKK